MPWVMFVIAIAIAALAAELFYISFHFDAYTVIEESQVSLWQAAFAQLGQLAKLLVVAVFVYLLLAKSRIRQTAATVLSGFRWPRFTVGFTAHLIAYTAMLVLTGWVFPQQVTRPVLPVWIYLGWLFSVLLTVGFWLLSLIGAEQLRRLITRERKALLLSLLAAIAAWALSLFSQLGWGVMVDATLMLSGWLLVLFVPELLVIDTTQKILGLGDFAVNISPACSGLEGIGLITAFTALYLYIERGSLRFPHALWLFPIGAISIWLFNSVRIATLVALGYYWSPEVAVGGFHSQAGWITFILSSLGLLWLADNSRFFHRSAAPAKSTGSINMPVATLIPLVALLTITLLDSALVADFNYWYPVRVVVVSITIFWVWRPLNLLPYRPSWIVLPAALLVTVLWIVLLGPQPDADSKFAHGLASMGASGPWWLLLRIVGTVVTVPIAEELGFRAYLLCKLAKTEVSIRGDLPLHWPAFALSSLAFGFLHGAWIAGAVAGAVYAWVRWRSKHIGDAILAHALTNALLVVYALVSGSWSVL
jgi:exosortase E/protease (VPEID-CTERM system)